MAVTTEVVVSIIFGVVMVTIGLFAIWQTAYHTRGPVHGKCQS